ncbi:hypothetical protein TNCT_716871 [Trichonephila clavata]|uniref:Peptidase M20 dimerisation domain-containing protein n=1 Tax=Trichonephila clavata TaxID=2740835 RepID=A0A8X6HYF1_TRICU|nr:hypothetical protein TNCT_716871 [Trichonephila clavata]
MSKATKLICFVFLLVINLILILLGIAIFRAVVLPKEHLPVLCSTDDKDYVSDQRGLSNRLSEALKFQTVNYEAHTYIRDEIHKFVLYIAKSFPVLHKSSLVSREVVNDLSLLYYVKGSNKSLKPYLLAGHLDVVPVEESYWEVPPFSGEIKNGYIWGRGSIDCKHVVMGILEAVEFLLEKGYKPKRSFYIAFGHDEESNGLDGAQSISSLLESRNVELEYILDEGTFVMEDLIPGLNFPVALISTSEKGALNIELSVHDTPGHSSFPKRESPIVILSKALGKLEGDMFPSSFGKGPEITMLEELAYCAPLPLKTVLANTWLFKPIIPLTMRHPIMSAIHRTTTAVTIVKGGNKLNVIPSSATGSVNFRIHPAQTVQEVLEFKSIKQIYKEACVVPSLLIANTDTKWYLNFTDSIYRFSLVRMKINETGRFHGHNERIGVKNYVDVVNFFVHLIKNSDETEVIIKHEHSEL